MPNETTIAPALTAEEWERRHFIRPSAVVLRRSSPDDCLDIAETASEENASVFVDPPAYHALAALALHGQPFGFTHEDVDALLAALRADYDGMGMGHWTGDGVEDRLSTLVDRIAALLPPR